MMKSFTFVLSALFMTLTHTTVSAHYIWTTTRHSPNGQSQTAVRQPFNNTPVEMGQINSSDMRCNVNPASASTTIQVSPGSNIGFILDNSLYHQGPAAIYLGKVPSGGGTAASWDGSGSKWFKPEDVKPDAMYVLTFQHSPQRALDSKSGVLNHEDIGDMDPADVREDNGRRWQFPHGIPIEASEDSPAGYVYSVGGKGRGGFLWGNRYGYAQTTGKEGDDTKIYAVRAGDGIYLKSIGNPDKYVNGAKGLRYKRFATALMITETTGKWGKRMESRRATIE